MATGASSILSLPRSARKGRTTSSSSRVVTACSVFPWTETLSLLQTYVAYSKPSYCKLNASGAPQMDRSFQLTSADLVVPNTNAWGLHWDFQTLRELADSLPGNSPLQNKAITTGNRIMNVFNKNNPETINAARKIAEEVFGEGWQKLQDGIYKEGWKKGDTRIWGIGHCHIDTAWWVRSISFDGIESLIFSLATLRLWPYRVTQQKVARSWSTQVDLMERYPEHRFTASSAQQYKWLEQVWYSCQEVYVTNGPILPYCVALSSSLRASQKEGPRRKIPPRRWLMGRERCVHPPPIHPFSSSVGASVLKYSWYRRKHALW